MNHQHPLISVIIPVFQAEKTIERCINSIVSNKAEIEIVCVDDGSKDNSLSILQGLSQKDRRLTVIHQENKGAGAARNKGLSIAHGEYIMFCDADDTYLDNTIDTIVDDINNYNSDYIVFHRKVIQLNGETLYVGCGNSLNVLHCEWYEYLNNTILSKRHGLGAVTKVFKKSIIDLYHIRFGNFKFGEDLWFILTYIIHAKSFVEDFRAYYQQYVARGSIVQSSYSNRFELNMEPIYQFVKDYPSEAKLIEPYIIDFKISCLMFSQEYILKGPDGASFREKMKLSKRLFSMKEVKDAIHQYLKLHPDLSFINKKIYRDILRGNFFTFYFIKYIIPRNIKKKIKKLIASK